MTTREFEASIREFTSSLVDEGLIPVSDAKKARARMRRLVADYSLEAAMQPGKPMPLLIDEEEAQRLTGIAYTAALQSGAKGMALEELASNVFRQLAAAVGSKAADDMNRRDTFQVIEAN